MPLSNRHSFHFARLLQNELALPEHVYQNINNRGSINRALHQHSKILRRHVNRPTRRKTTIISRVPIRKRIYDYIPSPFPERRRPVTVENQITQEPATKLSNLSTTNVTRPYQPVKPTSNSVAQQKRQYKPGTRKRLMALPPPRSLSGLANNALPLRLSAEERWLRAQQKASPSTKPSPPPKPLPPKPPELEATPVESTPHKEPVQQLLWKPGRGAVEKIDKLTGEIVHLAEEAMTH